MAERHGSPKSTKSKNQARIRRRGRSGGRARGKALAYQIQTRDILQALQSKYPDFEPCRHSGRAGVDVEFRAGGTSWIIDVAGHATLDGGNKLLLAECKLYDPMRTAKLTQDDAAAFAWKCLVIEKDLAESVHRLYFAAREPQPGFYAAATYARIQVVMCVPNQSVAESFGLDFLHYDPATEQLRWESHERLRGEGVKAGDSYAAALAHPKSRKS